MGIDLRDWAGSLGLHLLPFLVLASLLLPSARLDTIELRFEDVPVAREAMAPSKPIEIRKPTPPKPDARAAVYGASKKSLTSESSDLSFKAGNTVAKEKDERVLLNEPDSLPVPTDEYLVSKMPRLLEEVRIPYPAGAKSRGAQGAVVMDLLIDRAGSVREARLVRSPDEELALAALEAVKRFRFSPALRDEESVAVRIRYAYRFVLER